MPAIVNLANIHYARDELIEAQALYERAIGLDPDASRRTSTSATSSTISAATTARSVCYRDAVALNPGYADAHFYLAVTLEKTGTRRKRSRTGGPTRSSRRRANGWSWRRSFWSSERREP